MSKRSDKNIGQRLLSLGKLILKTFKEFGNDNAVMHAGALSYYTIFALPPMLFILISTFGFFVDRGTVQQKILQEVTAHAGVDVAAQIESMLDAISVFHGSWTATLIGIASLLFSCTVVFYTLQNSLNTFWKLKQDMKFSIIKLLKDRLLSFAMLVSIGFLLTVSLLLKTAIASLSNWLHGENMPFEFLSNIFDDRFFNTSFWLELAFTMFVNALVFSYLFKFLSNGKVVWKVAIAGGIFTSVLFELGEMGISYYISTVNFASTYGATGAILILLSWIYYSSITVFLGAEFTYIYAVHKGKPILLSPKYRKQLD